MLTILHAIPDSDDPYAIVAKVIDAVPSGSYLAITHAGSDLIDPAALQGLHDRVNGKVQQQFQWRTREQVARFFADTDLVEPGLVPVDAWRPEPGTGDPGKPALWAAVARKR
jgi:hypothetical protein